MTEIEDITKIVNNIVKKDKTLKLCPICGGTTFIPAFIIITLCAYCKGRGFIKK